MRAFLVIAVCAIVAFPLPLSVLGQSRGAIGVSDAETSRRTVRAVADSLRTVRTPEPVPLKGWKPSRHAWGDPDLEGVYTNNDEWGTPFERPAEFSGRTLASIASQELAKVRDARREAFLERLATGVPAEPGTIGWYDTLNVKNRSLDQFVGPSSHDRDVELHRTL
jgi:hypothetical protein